MKTVFLPLTSFAVAAGISLVSLLTPQPSVAQLNQVDNQPGGFDSQNLNDPCAAIGQNFNAFNLIHCARLRRRSWDSYQSQGTIDSAAAEYRKKQQERFRKQQAQNNSAKPGLPIILVPNSSTSDRTK
ncbi:hypothetical protein [Calothrix rhizosoleniae]|uniref:hypothetical protein n=1 Tax=Calothrix rhizosoleniae TaxID=888997 RepID=UPI000B4A28F8|nr:hypothetical protein [Calothrix rhizosoleniae]